MPAWSVTDGQMADPVAMAGLVVGEGDVEAGIRRIGAGQRTVQRVIGGARVLDRGVFFVVGLLSTPRNFRMVMPT